MMRVDWFLACVLAVGIVITTLLFRTHVILDRRKFEGMPPAEYARHTPFWRSLVAVLGFAAIIFAIDVFVRIHVLRNLH